MKERLDPTRLSEDANKLKEFLSLHMIQQERAIHEVVKAYNLSLSKLATNQKPILTMFSAGPSGVGKTLLAQLVAEFLLGSRNAMTKISCENYKQSHQVATLIGAPPGFVGYDEHDPQRPPNPPALAQEKIDRFAESQNKDKYKDRIKNDSALKKLTAEFEAIEEEYRKIIDDTRPRLGKRKDLTKEEMDRFNQFIERLIESEDAINVRMRELKGKQYSVILFDEIEKAHRDVHDFLLGVIDEGKVKLGNDDETSFKNSFIFLTSNVGSDKIVGLMKKKPGRMGFGNDEEFKDIDKAIYLNTSEEIKNMFRAEFVGRIKEHIVVFHPLQPDALRKIEEVTVATLAKEAQDKLGVTLHVSDTVKEFILKKATDHPEYGARLINEKVQKHLTEPLSSLEGSGQIFRGDTVFVELEGENLIFSRESGSPNSQEVLLSVTSEKPK